MVLLDLLVQLIVVERLINQKIRAPVLLPGNMIVTYQSPHLLFKHPNFHKQVSQIQTKKLKKFLLFSCVILIFITLFQLRNISLTDESLVVREQLNAAAAKLWSQSPIFGIGFGNFLVELPQVLPSRSVYFLQPVHNIYLLILSETGIIGLILFLWLIWKSIGKAISKNERNHFITYHLSLITLLLLGLVDHYPLTLQQGQLLLSFLLSLSLAY